MRFPPDISRALPRALKLPTLALCAALAGCQTPDLKPFAAASAGVAAGIKQGGDFAIAQIAREPALVDGELVAPDAPNHPAKSLATEWKTRRRAADAIVVYSGALAAIGDAAANRKANASALLGAVKQLASAVPGVSLGSDAAGNVVVQAASGVIEIKAFRDMGEAVKNADLAIRVIGAALRQDMRAMADLHAGYHTNQLLLLKTDPAYRKLVELHKKLRTEQLARREPIAANPMATDAGIVLTRIDALLTGVEKDLNPRLAAIAQHQAALAAGESFYAAVGAAIDAWLDAHHDLVATFTEKRTLDLALLLVRAQEIQAAVEELKASRHQPASP